MVIGFQSYLLVGSLTDLKSWWHNVAGPLHPRIGAEEGDFAPVSHDQPRLPFLMGNDVVAPVDSVGCAAARQVEDSSRSEAVFGADEPGDHIRRLFDFQETPSRNTA